MAQEVLAEAQAEALLARFVSVARSRLTESVDEALATAALLKYPVVLKIISSKALHKTEIHGVQTVKSADELVKQYAVLVSAARRRKLPLEGILVQEFVQGTELFIGLKRDKTFGHVLLFGIGGIFVEVLKDIAFRVCPITETDALDMMAELRAKQVLEGVRGKQPVNKKALSKMLVAISRIPIKHANIKELDINPFIATPSGGKVADARVVLE